jgi:maleylacetoacetate isomerase
MRLYSFFRSSAAFRVRIALNLKAVDYETVAVSLPQGRHRLADFTSLNPQSTIPVLDDDGTILWQSLAIIEYLDSRYPQPRLVPTEPVTRARVQALAQLIACDIHPLNNLRVLRYLTHDLKVGEDDKNRWYRHWVETGLEVVERQLAQHPSTGRFCHGDTPGLADCVLVPQIFNAQRFNCRLEHVPTVMRVYEACMQLDAFTKTQPSACPDAE